MNTDYTITTNTQYNSIEISFQGKPSEEIREALKALRFRWHGQKKVWYGYSTEEAAREAIEKAAAPLVIPAASFVDGGGLYDGWKGGNNRKWNTEKELKAFLMEDFKRAGIGASVRFNRAGYLTSITVTIKITSAEIKPFEEWEKDFMFPGSGWVSYKDENGIYRDIPKEPKKQESIEVGQILSRFPDWEKVGRVRMGSYGQQRCWRKKVTTTQ